MDSRVPPLCGPNVGNTLCNSRSCSRLAPKGNEIGQQQFKSQVQKLAKGGSRGSVIYLVRILDGGLGVSGRVADDDGRIHLGRGRSGATNDLDRDLVVDELARYIADADLALDVIFLEAEVAAFDGDQGAAFDRTT